MVEGKLVKLLEFAENCITEKTGKPLADVQKNILRQALEGQRLKDIQVSGYSQNTIKSDMAPKLWKQLSDVTGRKVTIKTLRLVLEEVLEEFGDRPSTSGSTGGLGSPASPQLSQPPLASGTGRSPLLERPGGQIPLNSPFYIQRSQTESLAYEEIAKPGSLIRIKAPKQMGKTSLMARLLHHAERLGCQTVALNFELADNEVFANLDSLLRRFFCASVAKALRLPLDLIDKCWSEGYTNKMSCTEYFEEYVLPAIGKPLVLGLDKVDLIFPHEKVADDFFVLLRAWYEKTKENSIWKNFRMIIVHGTEVYIPLSNDQSPFNVGLPVELPEFDASQVQDLAQLHGLNFTADQVNRLMAMIGGHPHLTRTALYKIANQEIELEELLKDAPTDMGIYADRLRLHWWHLQQHPELMRTLGLVLSSKSAVELDSIVKFKLNSLGLVLLQGDLVTIRNDLYRQYFRDRLNFLQNNSGHFSNTNTLDQEEYKSPFNSNFLGDNILATIVFTDVKDSARKAGRRSKNYPQCNFPRFKLNDPNL